MNHLLERAEWVARRGVGGRWSLAGVAMTSLCAVIAVACQDPERGITVNGGSGGEPGGASGSGATPGGSGGASGAAAGTTDPGSGGTGGGNGDASAPGGTGGGADAAIEQPIDQPGTGGAEMPTIDPRSLDAGVKADLPVIQPQPPAPLQECTTPSLDRLQQWVVGNEMGVVTAPAQGNILAREANGYIGKVTFVGNGWHVVAVWIANMFSSDVDLTNAGGVTVTYTSTAPLWVQMRPASRYSGGNHFLVALPSTGGQLQAKYIPFSAAAWTWLPRLGMPGLQFTDAIKEVRALVFVGDVANQVVFYGLRFDNFVPVCR
ncbi:MAG TPA: hypothetical protein VFH73_26865 [Polyangia bacterium]|nr:hypothetical protein [Polyangia bacterium]